MHKCFLFLYWGDCTWNSKAERTSTEREISFVLVFPHIISHFSIPGGNTNIQIHLKKDNNKKYFSSIHGFKFGVFLWTHLFLVLCNHFQLLTNTTCSYQCDLHYLAVCLPKQLMEFVGICWNALLPTWVPSCHSSSGAYVFVLLRMGD